MPIPGWYGPSTRASTCSPTGERFSRDARHVFSGMRDDDILKFLEKVTKETVGPYTVTAEKDYRWRYFVVRISLLTPRGECVSAFTVTHEDLMISRDILVRVQMMARNAVSELNQFVTGRPISSPTISREPPKPPIRCMAEAPRRKIIRPKVVHE